MGYINKESLLTAYKILSQNTASPSNQGATQMISAIRYLFALDHFVNKYNRDCDTKQKEDRDHFIEYVGEIVSINKSFYTSNFFTDVKKDKDFKVGSNFFSVNVVKESLTNADAEFDFPRRAKNKELFGVKNGILLQRKNLIKNSIKYMPSEECRIALMVWICRNENFSSNEIKYSDLHNTLSSKYSTDLISSFFPDNNSFDIYIKTNGELHTQSNHEDIEIKEIFNLFTTRNNMIISANSKYRTYITAIKSKPFLLLAGISGTGKSRIVRELARACWEEGTEEYMAQKPSNFEMVQVKPNWHNSNELIGFVSRVSGEAEYIAGDFLKFVARAWMNPNVPHFLCLDEMNLAPVEQYFAEFLSVIESRKSNEDGNITTDPILKKSMDDWYRVLTAELTEDNEEVRNRFLEEGICIPQNLIVVGTVNMDETTYSFSRKVLDRAMSIEMNEVDLYGGLTSRHESIGKLEYEDLVGNAVEGVDVYIDNKEVCDVALDYLSKVNEVLNGTPFKIAYRTRNEFLLYVVNNLPYNKDKEDNELSQGYVIARALDEITSMKILSRIEGDDSKVRESLLNNLNNVIETELNAISGNEYVLNSISLAKLKEMKEKLAYGYTSFWS